MIDFKAKYVQVPLLLHLLPRTSNPTSSSRNFLIQKRLNTWIEGFDDRHRVEMIPDIMQLVPSLCSKLFAHLGATEREALEGSTEILRISKQKIEGRNDVVSRATIIYTNTRTPHLEVKFTVDT